MFVDVSDGIPIPVRSLLPAISPRPGPILILLHRPLVHTNFGMTLDVALPVSELFVGAYEVTGQTLPLEALVGAGDHLGVLPLSVLSQRGLLRLRL